MRIGVLAYGSLVDDAGAELEEATAERGSGVRTPFRVEFARHSSGRDGAPTLVPVTQGGAYVEAAIIVLKPGVSLDVGPGDGLSQGDRPRRTGQPLQA